MDLRQKIAATTLVAMAVSPTLFAANAPALSPVSCAPTMTTVSCASPASPVKVTAKVPTAGATAKVYFKAAGQQDEYYVEMRRVAPNDDTMVAFVPEPARSTPSFTYRVVAMDVNGVQVATPLSTATVTPSCPAVSLTSDQQRMANNLIVGLTTPLQSAVPTGFLCRNIVSYIDTNGDLRPNQECRRVVAMGIDGTPSAYATTTTATSTATTSMPAVSVGTSNAATNATTALTTGTNAAATGTSTAATGATTAGTTGGVTAGTIGMSHGTIVALTALGLLGAGAVIANNHHNNSNNQVSPSRP